MGFTYNLLLIVKRKLSILTNYGVSMRVCNYEKKTRFLFLGLERLIAYNSVALKKTYL